MGDGDFDAVEPDPGTRAETPRGCIHHPPTAAADSGAPDRRASIVFTLMHLTPGDPASVMLGRDATPEQKEALRERLGLNEPVPVQFVNWFGSALRLDFGDSLFIGKPVTEALLDRAEPTILLALYAITLSHR